MAIEEDLKTVEEKLVIIEKYLNSYEWNPFEETKVTQAIKDSDKILNLLIVEYKKRPDNMSEEQIGTIRSLTQRLQKNKKTTFPSRRFCSKVVGKG